MRTHTYYSFEEIDNDLKILKLKREINKENVKFSLQSAKTDLYPDYLVGKFTGLLQQYMLDFTVRKLRKLVRLS